jgi:hypothetical protein
MKGLYGQFACAMPRDSRMVAVGPLGRLIYVEAALYCRENLTDGVIDRAQLSFWTPDVTRQRKVKLLNELATLGALEFITDGWRIPWNVWCEWNPTRSEVEDKRRQDAERKAEWRAKRMNQSQRSPEDVPLGQTWDTTSNPVRVPDSQSQSQSHSQRQSQSQSNKPSPSRYLRPAHGEVGELIKGLFHTVDEEAS